MLRFTIRDVLWLTLVVALMLGWGVDRGRLADRLAATNTTMRTQEYHLEEALLDVDALKRDLSHEHEKLSQAVRILKLENGAAPDLP